jgi:hypothetical protein
MQLTLYNAHRILIAFAIGLGVLLLAYGIEQFARAGSVSALGTGIGGAVACLALAIYLRWFLRKRSRPA